MEIKEDECIPFPHEAHQVLTQELLHVFSSQVLVAAGIGSGLSVLGGLLAGSRVVALCSSKAHMKFVSQNVTNWCREKKIVPGTLLPKPGHLVSYEAKKGRTGVNQPKAPAPTPPATPKNPGPALAPSPSTAASSVPSPSPSPSTNGAPGKNLLSAFGNAAM